MTDWIRDDAFVQAIYQRRSTIEQCIWELLPKGPDEDYVPPGDPEPPPPMRLRADCLAYLEDQWVLVTQFTGPNAADAWEMRENIAAVLDQNLVPLNLGGGAGDESFIRTRINAQIGSQDWVGAGRDAFEKRLRDLILAVASQQEFAGVLQGTMDLHWSLLSSSRSAVLAVLDKTIQAMRDAIEDMRGGFGDLIERVWGEVKGYLAALDVVGVLTDVKSVGPAGAVRTVAHGLGSTVLHLPLGALFEGTSSDPMVPLEAMVAELRAVRKATQQDSAKIAGLLGELDPYLSGDRRTYLVHEEGPVLPDSDNKPDPGGGTTMEVDPNSLERIGVILTEARDTLQVARDRMVAADSENGVRPFAEYDVGTGREPMFAEMKERWPAARVVLEQAMGATMTGTEVTVQSLSAAANLYRRSEQENHQIMHKIAMDLGMGQ
ncbi:hypothetical protein ACIOD2_47410 [Amycolatopsis sp. NPDC088138]|uniref:hypothetical protein n=1 Tax=Amycolatopsis sp. NPDC088138 TaxID=3363938 RepID=UPI003817DADE